MRQKPLEKKYKVNVGRMFRIRNVQRLIFSNSSSANYSENVQIKVATELFGPNLVTMVIDETYSRVAAYVEPYGKIWMSKHFLLKEFVVEGLEDVTGDSAREVLSELAELYCSLLEKNDTKHAIIVQELTVRIKSLLESNGHGKT